MSELWYWNELKTVATRFIRCLWGTYLLFLAQESSLAKMKTLSPSFDLMLYEYLLTKLLSKYLYFALTRVTVMIQADFSIINKILILHCFLFYFCCGLLVFIIVLLWLYWIIWKKLQIYCNKMPYSFNNKNWTMFHCSIW